MTRYYELFLSLSTLYTLEAKLCNSENLRTLPETPISVVTRLVVSRRLSGESMDGWCVSMCVFKVKLLMFTLYIVISSYWSGFKLILLVGRMVDFLLKKRQLLD